MDTVFRFLLRLVLLAAGLVFAASLAVAMVLLAAVWSLRMLWARLTGRPVRPFVMRVDPRSGFNRMARAARGAAAPPARRDLADVTDVVPKEPRG
ncbi:MAG: hypothetical protein U1E71_03910 [Ramlibacter sp.]|jgi:hypothetical protein